MSYRRVTEAGSGGLRAIAVLLGLVLPGAWMSQAQTTVFVVRHADRDASEPDAALTQTGQRRAESLGVLLRDAGVRRIFTTEFRRTEQTAAPTARISQVSPEVVKQADLGQLTERIRSRCVAGEAVLVVGHRATVPRIVKALAGADIEPLGSSEYDRLVVLTLFPGGRASVVTLRYGGEGKQ